MALNITIPYSAKPQFFAATKVYSRRPGVAVSEFMQSRGLSEADIRARAESGGTTLNEAFRRYVVEAHPSMASVWSERKLTTRQKLGLSAHAKHPDTDTLRRALYLLHSVVHNPDDRKVRATALQFLSTFGVTYELP
jgi:hypothetical protein